MLEWLVKQKLYTRFPESVSYCDVRRGLGYKDCSVAIIYSSHMFEHLPWSEAEKFLFEAYRVLKIGGILRLVLPDLERRSREYLNKVELLRVGSLDIIPADEFMKSCLLGVESPWTLRRPGDVYRTLFAHGHHWMWDAPSLMVVLRQVGFRQVWEKGFGDSLIPQIEQLDIEQRRDESFYVEAEK